MGEGIEIRQEWKEKGLMERFKQDPACLVMYIPYMLSYRAVKNTCHAHDPLVPRPLARVAGEPDETFRQRMAEVKPKEDVQSWA